MSTALTRIGAQSDSWPHFVSALAGARLPTQDLLDPHQAYFALLDGGQAVAYGGFAQFGRDALLRSIVVPAAGRRRGHGRAVVEALLDQLRQSQVDTAWLLTETPDFFQHLGFTRAPRDAAPAPIAGTREFTALCPSSAPLMSRRCVP